MINAPTANNVNGTHENGKTIENHLAVQPVDDVDTVDAGPAIREDVYKMFTATPVNVCGQNTFTDTLSSHEKSEDVCDKNGMYNNIWCDLWQLMFICSE